MSWTPTTRHRSMQKRLGSTGMNVWKMLRPKSPPSKAKVLCRRCDFTGLSDGASFPVGQSLDIAVEVTAQSGLDDIRLLLNGVRVGKPISKSSVTWKASEFPELANLEEDWYSLQVIAVDEKGFVVDKEIYVRVGNQPGEKQDWILEPFVVLMTDGQELLSGVATRMRRWKTMNTNLTSTALTLSFNLTTKEN